MDIVILDGYSENPGDLSWAGMEALGRLTVYDRTPAGLEAERIGGAEAVFVNKTPLSAETIAACPNLRFIGVLATGYNIVDTAAATRAGITVTNIPTYGTNAVAQFAIALLLEVCHHIGHHSAAVAEGRWHTCPDWCFWDYPLTELADKTMGIIGYGRIGRTTGRIAQALGMKVLAYDSYKDPSLESETCRYTDLEELFAKSDVICLHCPLFPDTQGIINKDTIAKMKDGVIIINNSRGPLIAEADLLAALESGKVRAAGLDVLCEEPPRSVNPLIGAKNCIVTPHISWAPSESRARLMDIAVANLKAFIDGKPVNTVAAAV